MVKNIILLIIIAIGSSILTITLLKDSNQPQSHDEMKFKQQLNKMDLAIDQLEKQMKQVMNQVQLNPSEINYTRNHKNLSHEILVSNPQLIDEIKKIAESTFEEKYDQQSESNVGNFLDTIQESLGKNIEEQIRNNMIKRFQDRNKSRILEGIDLTEVQQEEIDKIFSDYYDVAQKIFMNEEPYDTMNSEERRESFIAARDTRDEKMEQLLPPDQYSTYQTNLKNTRENRWNRFMGMGNNNSTSENNKN